MRERVKREDDAEPDARDPLHARVALSIEAHDELIRDVQVVSVVNAPSGTGPKSVGTRYRRTPKERRG